MQLRRMSRLVRMGVYSGMDCLRKAGVEKPDGIITGTGKGSMVDTEKFVKELSKYREEALNPTPFIMSTYNAINGAIALQTGATGYNQTYVHRGSSFEVSLYDAQLKLHTAGSPRRYLVGCFDEITPEYFLVKDKIGYWKKDRDPALPLWQQCGSAGSIAGEGTAFFLLSNEAANAVAVLHQVCTCYNASVPRVLAEIHACLGKQGWQAGELDMLVLGLNGDREDHVFYEEVRAALGAHLPVLAFKHLCGEYETSGGFALWLTCALLSGQPLPAGAWYRAPGAGFIPKKILYYNHYRRLNHNIMLLSD